LPLHAALEGECNFTLVTDTRKGRARKGRAPKNWGKEKGIVALPSVREGENTLFRDMKPQKKRKSRKKKLLENYNAGDQISGTRDQ